MNIYIKRINGIQGFVPTTYVVFNGDELVKIVGTKKEAETIKQELEKNNNKGDC
jgi:hypothetical protein